MVPSIGVMPREGSFALASFGRTRKVQEPSFSFSAGRKSFALKRIDAVLVIWLVSLKKKRKKESEPSRNAECGVQRRTLVIVLLRKREVTCCAELRYQLTRLAR